VDAGYTSKTTVTQEGKDMAKDKLPTSQPPEQLDERPGDQGDMEMQPQTDTSAHIGTDKLRGKVAIITGGDSGIGRATAIAFAKEGADIVIAYLEEDEDAKEAKDLVEKHGQKCLLVRGDVGSEAHCQALVKQTIQELGRVDIVVNNAGEQHPQNDLEGITEEQLESTFRTNIFSMFFLSKAALPHLKEGSSILNTASVTAYRGHPELLDYASTKGAIVSFTRSLAMNLADKQIRVNAVAPGPIWTPLIPSTFPKEKVQTFGKDTPMKRAGQPYEVAMAFVFLASEDASYMTGQTLHVNGGAVVTT
jgi:NAD(P)-dependent dehydrogenase (short-subunit alcohol dehydrogenase family)